MARLWLLALALAATNRFAAEHEAVFGREWQRVTPSGRRQRDRVAALRTWRDTPRTTGLVVVANGPSCSSTACGFPGPSDVEDSRTSGGRG
jgi:hypothetical protein